MTDVSKRDFDCDQKVERRHMAGQQILRLHVLSVQYRNRRPPVALRVRASIDGSRLIGAVCRALRGRPLWAEAGVASSVEIRQGPRLQDAVQTMMLRTILGQTI
jgi:hypothetical protein